jgi:hypothetical protein
MLLKDGANVAGINPYKKQTGHTKYQGYAHAESYARIQSLSHVCTLFDLQPQHLPVPM